MFDIVSTDLTPLIEPVYKEVISVLIKPYISKLGQWIKKTDVRTQVVDNYFENIFESYLTNLFRNNSYVNTLAFPNQRVTLDSVYEPLTLSSYKKEDQYLINNEGGLKILSEHKRIIISDSAGMGKSTIAKWISREIIKDSHSIPVLIELKKVTRDTGIISEILFQLDKINEVFDKDLLFKFLEIGSFTIILDGFDEIEKDSGSYVIEEIKNLIKKAPNNRYLITSRPDVILTSFGEFQVFFINSLTTTQAYSLIRKYDRLNDISYSEALIDDINNKIEQVQEFLSNPLLLSLLYKSYTYTKDIPLKKSVFYDEVYSALFKNHDLTKDGFKREKISKLDIIDFRSVLRSLAFLTTKQSKTSYFRYELVDLIEQIKSRNSNLMFSADFFIEDLSKTVPLFSVEGNQVKWIHKSFQDFFTAEYIIKSSSRDDIIKAINKKRDIRYMNIIDLIFELDIKSFQWFFLIPVLDAFITSTQISYKNIESSDLDLCVRRSITFNFNLGFIITKDDGFSAQETLKRYLMSKGFNLTTLQSMSTSLADFVVCSMNTNPFGFGIMDIMKTKGVDIFMNDLELYIKDAQDRYSSLLDGLQSDTPYIIDDNPHSLINSRENFRQVTKFLLLLFGNRKNQPIVLDFDKCKIITQRIRQELEIDRSKHDAEGI